MRTAIYDYIRIVVTCMAITMAIILLFKILAAFTHTSTNSNNKSIQRRIINMDTYSIDEIDKHIVESIWPDDEFPVNIYVTKNGTDLVGTYKLEKVEYTPRSEE